MGAEIYQVRLLFLGGLDEIGKSALLLETPETAVLIDCGASIRSGASSEYPGLEHLPEDINWKLSGIVFTHGHEDHIGAAAYFHSLFPQIPAYGSKETGLFLKKKVCSSIDYRDTVPYEKVLLGEFHIEFLPVTHSIPGAYALYIVCGDFRMLHTGDFCFDGWPEVPGWVLESQRYRDCELLTLDSTSAPLPARSVNEDAVAAELIEICRTAPLQLYVSCFSSHLNRIRSIISAARISGRQIAVSGKAMAVALDIAGTMHYPELEGADIAVLSESSIDGYIRRLNGNGVCLLVSGSQGEPDSILDKISKGTLPVDDDAGILLSSACIPGNETQYYSMLNRLAHRTGHLYLKPSYSVHTSGHASREEICLLLGALSPRKVLPVHGERWLKRAAEQAVRSADCSLQSGVVNGRYLEWHKTHGFSNGRTLFSGVDELHHSIVQERIQLSKNGIVVVYLPRRGMTLGEPAVIMSGVIRRKTGKQLLLDIEYAVSGHCQELICDGVCASSVLNREIRTLVKKMFRDSFGWEPMVLADIVELPPGM